VDEGHRALRTRVGYSLHHEALSRVSASQLLQHHLVGELRRRDQEALCKLQHVCGRLWKGLSAQGLKRGELTRVDLGGMMSQRQHRVGHLFMEENIARPKTMLILL
jgi:hypothetical protein